MSIYMLIDAFTRNRIFLPREERQYSNSNRSNSPSLYMYISLIGAFINHSFLESSAPEEQVRLLDVPSITLGRGGGQLWKVISEGEACETHPSE
jgi:hypothetical protein